MKRFLLMGITLGFLLSWAVESIADQPKRGGTLTMAIRKDITLLPQRQVSPLFLSTPRNLSLPALLSCSQDASS